MALSVRNKLGLLAPLSVLGLISLSFVSYQEVATVYSAASYANDNTVPSVRVLDEAADGISTIRAMSWKSLALTDSVDPSATDRTIQAAVRKVRAAFAAYEPLISDAKDRALLAADRAAFDAYDTLIEKALLAAQNRWVDARDAMLEHNKNFDLILMDMDMPVMDGIEATRRIRAAEATGLLAGRRTIIALTANVLRESVEACRTADTDDSLSKPFQRQQIVDVLARWLEESTLAAGSSTQGG